MDRFSIAIGKKFLETQVGKHTTKVVEAVTEPNNYISDAVVKMNTGDVLYVTMNEKGYCIKSNNNGTIVGRIIGTENNNTAFIRIN